MLSLFCLDDFRALWIFTFFIVFPTNENFLILIFFEPDGVNLKCLKIMLFDLTEFYGLKYLRSMSFKKRVCGKDFILWQVLL